MVDLHSPRLVSPETGMNNFGKWECPVCGWNRGWMTFIPARKAFKFLFWNIPTREAHSELTCSFCDSVHEYPIGQIKVSKWQIS